MLDLVHIGTLDYLAREQARRDAHNEPGKKKETGIARGVKAFLRWILGARVVTPAEQATRDARDHEP